MHLDVSFQEHLLIVKSENFEQNTKDMKEIHWFYDPEATDLELGGLGTLPEDESKHARNVLRLETGDEIMVTDGKGGLWRTCVEADQNMAGGRTNRKKAPSIRYRILERIPFPKDTIPKSWIAVAPTKASERIDWFAEKATEIGFQTLTPIITERSERRHITIDRLQRIAVSAMKQSHKAILPLIEESEKFTDFINRKDLPEVRLIAHCYEPEELPAEIPLRRSMTDVLRTAQKDEDILVLIGPEGDFCPQEVDVCVREKGFIPVSLGQARLRTETAALVAAHLISLRNEL